jgi:hypothetical protein
MMLWWRKTKRFFRRKPFEPTPVTDIQAADGPKNETPR